MTIIQVRTNFWIAAIVAALALFFTGLQPVSAAGELIEKKGINVSITATSTKDTYRLKVTGNTTTTLIKNVTIHFNENDYPASFKSSKKTFTLDKTVKVTGELPKVLTINAESKSGGLDQIEVNVPVVLVSEGSIVIKKNVLIKNEVYYYQVSGKVINPNLESLAIKVGSTEKTLEVTDGSFQTLVFEQGVTSIHFSAQSTDGEKQEFDVKTR